MNLIHRLKDNRSNSYSVLAIMKISAYLDYVNEAYNNKGGIQGQRAPLKTRTAQIVRRRLIDDLCQGAVIPAIVLGLLFEEEQFDKLDSIDNSGLEQLLKSIDLGKYLSIIDGMQRTTALFDARESEKFNVDNEIRIEFWLAKSTNSLLYRMLVLNSGQIPWNLRRQIEVIFKQFKTELETHVDCLKLIESDDSSRRKQPGEYQVDQFIELFMLFGLRKVSTSMQQQIAEEFARLDLIESTSKESFPASFRIATSILVDLDIAISRAGEIRSDTEISRFKTGRDLFTSHPARIGLIVAIAREIFGLPGIEKDQQVAERDARILEETFSNHVDYLNGLNEEELINVINFESLDERIKVPAGKVGEFEREYFTKAFSTLISLVKDSVHVSSYRPLWVA